MIFNIALTDKELDYIATVLAQRPWGEVNALLANIKNQIDMQQREPELPVNPPIKPYVVNGSADPGVDPH